MKDNEAKFLAIAESISDGDDIDWEVEGTGAEDEAGQCVIRRLQILSEISGFHQAAVGPPMEPGSQWKHLQIAEHIASGSFGEVYRATDTRLDREVALKILGCAEPDHNDGAVEEARLLAQVRNNNVVTVFGADSDERGVGIWMEYIRGNTLEQIVREQGPMGAQEAALAGIDICRALAAVHAEGLLHRDIKARNVMREEGGRMVLMDFGLGLDAAEADGRIGSLQGTPLYMAPSLLDGCAPDVHSDLYAVAVLLHHLVTGTFPVEGTSLEELRLAHRGDRKSLRDIRPDLPERFIRILEKGLAAKEEKRFASAGEMGRALSDSLEWEEGREKDEAPTGGSKKWFPWAVTAAVILTGLFYWGIREKSGNVYDIDVSLFRAGGTAEERLYSGSHVAPGDELFLELSSSTDLFTYVLNEDENGESYLLFPLQGYALSNPLAGGTQHRLPGLREGEEVHWQVTSAGGNEHFIIVTSPDPVAEIETAIIDMSQTEIGRPIIAAPIPQGTVKRLRGIGGAIPAAGGHIPDGGVSAPGSVGELAGQVAQSSEGVRGVWMRDIVLRNPAD